MHLHSWGRGHSPPRHASPAARAPRLRSGANRDQTVDEYFPGNTPPPKSAAGSPHCVSRMTVIPPLPRLCEGALAVAGSPSVAELPVIVRGVSKSGRWPYGPDFAKAPRLVRRPRAQHRQRFPRLGSISASPTQLWKAPSMASLAPRSVRLRRPRPASGPGGLSIVGPSEKSGSEVPFFSRGAGSRWPALVPAQPEHGLPPTRGTRLDREKRGEGGGFQRKCSTWNIFNRHPGESIRLFRTPVRASEAPAFCSPPVPSLPASPPRVFCTHVAACSSAAP